MTYPTNARWPSLKPLFRYINELWDCRCLPDLHTRNLFPNAKELTESCAAYNAVRNKARLFAFSDPTVTLIAAGDGCTPRTAAMFAFRSAWVCFSIDPNLRKTHWPNIDRLHCLSQRVEDCDPQHYPKLVIVAVHSHAPLDISCQTFTADQRLVVAIPCCVPQTRERPPDIEYVDKGIWSPHNKVLIWIDDEEEETYAFG